MALIGTRWHVGEAAPTSLPEPMREEIASMEGELTDAERARLSWTLHYVEGKPNVTIDEGSSIMWNDDLNIAYRVGMCG